MWQGCPVTKPTLLLSLLLLPAVLAACTPTVPAGPVGSGAASAPGPGIRCDYQSTGDAARPVDLPPADVTDGGGLGYTLRLGEDEVALTLDRDKAPCTVNSFTSLAAQGFFEGTSCHRLVDGPGLFVLQCGDPTGTGSGGPGYQFADELDGTETYPAGTLAMANAGPGTNGSQFFIVYADSQLAPNYTVFGHTDKAGVELLTGLAAGGQDGTYPDGSGAPNNPVVITGLAPA